MQLAHAEAHPERASCVSSEKVDNYFIIKRKNIFQREFTYPDSKHILIKRLKGDNIIYLLWVLIVGGLIGWISGNLIGKDIPGGVLGNVIAGFIGSWLGVELLGARGPVIGGFHIIPAIVGSIIALLIFFALARGGAFGRR